MSADVVNLTIDGRRVTAQPGTTILQAAESVGVRIPTLCYEPDLGSEAVCRICVVEVEATKTLVASCATPVAEGIMVKTNSPTVVQTRRTCLELMLANHAAPWLPNLGSDSGVRLRELAEELNVLEPGLEFQPRASETDFNDPMIVRDHHRCILCDKCVAVCANRMGVKALWRVGRGMDTRIGSSTTGQFLDTDCVHCGNCISVCPSAALADQWRYKYGEADRKAPTICTYCGTGCRIYVHIKDGRIIGASPDPENPVNRGYLCIKGRFALDFVHHPDRLLKPLIREKDAQGRRGDFREASWQEALNLVSRRFREIKERFGPDSIAAVSSSRCTNEENFLMQKLMRAVIGTNNVDNCARVCHSPSVSGLAAAFGSGAATNSLEEIEGAEVIMVIGSNTTEAHPIIAMKIRRAVTERGAKLIVVDPRKIELCKIADIWLSLLPGTNIALINGMLNVIIDEKLYDAEFIQTKTEGFEELKQVVASYTPLEVAKITRVPADDIMAAAHLYASSKKSMIIYGLGITEHRSGTYNVMSCANLALITGNIGRAYTGVNPLRGQNNVQGACDMGALPNFYVGYESVSDEVIRNKYAAAWSCEMPKTNGLKMPEMFEGALNGEVKAVYIMAEDPAITDPNINHLRQCLNSLDFLVVQDLFLTETAKMADVVLPGASHVEKEGTFTNAERRIQLFRSVIEPVGESKPDWKIICLLSESMGYPMPYASPKEVWDEIASLCPAFAGVNYDRLEKGSLRWPCTSQSHPGTPFLYEDGFPIGKARFHDLPHMPAAELPDEEYPFILTTGRRLEHYCSGSMTRRSPALIAVCPEELCEIHPEDAARLGIESGDKVQVTSRRGEVTVKAKVTDKSPPGVVFLSFHFNKTPSNVLTGPGSDTIALTPEYKVCAVRLRKVEKRAGNTA